MRKTIVLVACAGLLALTATAASARTGPVSIPSAPRANPAAVLPADLAVDQVTQAEAPADGFCLRLRRGEDTTTYLCILRTRPAEPGVGKCRRVITIPDLVSLMGCRTS
jgi:hypothetical protein